MGEHDGFVVGDALAKLASPIEVSKIQFIVDRGLEGKERKEKSSLRASIHRKQCWLE